MPAPPRPAAGTEGVALVLLAAGQGSRVGHPTNKVLLPLAGRRVLVRSLDVTTGLPGLGRTVIVVREDDRIRLRTLLAREVPDRPVTLVVGGATRHASELHALRALAPDIRSGAVDLVVMHDAARPLTSAALFDQVCTAARRYGGGLPVLDQPGLVYADGTAVTSRLVTVQTPQAFRARPLLEAYEQAETHGFSGSDTASAFERFTNLHVRAVHGDATNIKITFPEDLLLAERLLARRC